VWFLFGVLGFTLLAGAAWVLTQVPLPPEAPQAQTTILYDAKGGQLATLHGAENRFPVTLDQVPQVMQAAVVSAEDRKYFNHGGIDPIGILRATWADLRHKGARQGGSTLTQQYVKNVYVGSDATLWRKLREAVISVKLERKLDKRQILERYLNTVYFGRGAYGVQAAAKAYFGLDVSQLGLKESAYLAGIIREPSGGDVANDPNEARDLRSIVLTSMVRDQLISQEEKDQVEAVPLKTYVSAKADAGSTVSLQNVGAEYFVEYVRRQLVQLYPEDTVLRGGMRVYTTLDPDLQRQAYDSVYGLLNGDKDPAGALVSLDPDGRVVAMVGGKSWLGSQVNLAVGAEGGGAGRQAGSTFKPVVLAQTMDDGYGLDSTFNGPATIVLPKADQGVDWEVNNYEGASYGRISLLDATASSVNTVYAQLVVAVGPQKVVDMAKRLGVKADLAPNASIALGTAEVSVMDMADVYLTLANKGMQSDPRVIGRIVQNGSVLVEDKPKSVRAVDRTVADKVGFALEQVVERGSGTAAAIPQAQVWGKTGTTDNFGDAWFVGYTRKLTTAVWMGYPEGQSHALYNIHGVAKVNGGSLPAQIFRRFMSKASPPDDTPPPPPPDLSGKSVPTAVPVPPRSAGAVPSAGPSTRSTAEPTESPSTTARTATAPAPATPAPTPTLPPPTAVEPTSPPTSRVRPTIPPFPSTSVVRGGG
jgi:penicillin-binding protein 1A